MDDNLVFTRCQDFSETGLKGRENRAHGFSRGFGGFTPVSGLKGREKRRAFNESDGHLIR